MHGFSASGDAYVARLDPGERGVLRTVVADVAALLGAPPFDEDDAVPAPGLSWSTEAPPPPSDPAVHRLLPDASRDDPEVAAEFRRLTEGDLRARKIAGLRLLWTALGTPDDAEGDDDEPAELRVAAPDGPAVAAAITDVRLVLAERLDVRTDEDAERLYDALDAAPRSAAGRNHQAMVAVYAALSWLQESLVHLMLEDARRRTSHGRGGRRRGRDG